LVYGRQRILSSPTRAVHYMLRSSWWSAQLLPIGRLQEML